MPSVLNFKALLKPKYAEPVYLSPCFVKVPISAVAEIAVLSVLSEVPVIVSSKDLRRTSAVLELRVFWNLPVRENSVAVGSPFVIVSVPVSYVTL